MSPGIRCHQSDQPGSGAPAWPTCCSSPAGSRAAAWWSSPPRHDFRHRVTTEIIKLAKAQGRDLIAVEDLQISNMTASARGTPTHPGRNVRAKTGLNRSILQQGWAEILTMLARLQGPQSRNSASSPSGPHAHLKPAATAGPSTPSPEGPKATSRAPPVTTRKTPTSTPAGSSLKEDWQNSGKEHSNTREPALTRHSRERRGGRVVDGPTGPPGERPGQQHPEAQQQRSNFAID